MPRNKDLKRLVRARMKKTGEAYTAARSQVTRKPKPQPPAATFAELAGMSDAAIKEKTGCAWDKWVKSLDYHGAAQMSHRDIATLLHEKYKVQDWWAQTVTVGYERIKGIRARGQRLDGSYEASKSRTYNVPVKELYAAWADAKMRKRWLDGASLKVRTATAPKSMRLDWPEGGIIAVWFTAKGESKSAVALAHTRLPDKKSADRLKEYWSDRLDALGKMLTDR